MGDEQTTSSSVFFSLFDVNFNEDFHGKTAFVLVSLAFLQLLAQNLSEDAL